MSIASGKWNGRTTSLEELARERPCSLCGKPCDGTAGIVRIGHCCADCIARWRAGEDVVMTQEGFRWNA